VTVWLSHQPILAIHDEQLAEHGGCPGLMFLALNGVEFEPAEVDATITMLRLATGELSDDEFIAWVRANARVPPDQGR
jgi:hypothetical protein